MLRHRGGHPAGRVCWAAWLWAAIVALLRDRFNANEILVSLMLVYVAEMLLSYWSTAPGRTPRATTSRRPSPSTR
jgi:ABC-type uncharacterized transport system permease subunit